MLTKSILQGYKKTEIGIIPEDWNEFTINSLSKSFTKQTGFDYSAYIKPKLITTFKSGTLPFIQNKDFKEKKINFDTDYYIPEDVANNFPRILLDEKCLLISISGSIGKIGIFSNFRKAFVGGAVAVVKFKDIDQLDWIMYYLLSNAGQNSLLNNVKAGSHQNLILADIRKIIVPITSEKERKTIVGIISDIDELIQNIDKLISKKKDTQKGTMQDLLTGKRRLAGFTKPWNVMTFEDVSDKKIKWSITGGPFGSNLKINDYVSNGVRIIQLQNIGDGKFKDDYKIFTSEKKADELLSANIYPNEIIISKMGDPVGRACFIPNKDRRYLMASDGIRLAVDESKFDKKFVLYYINSSYFRNRVIEASTGSTRQRIGLKDLKKIQFHAPSLAEQQIIGTILYDMKSEIKGLEKERDKFIVLKNGVIEKLLTGEIRLK